MSALLRRRAALLCACLTLPAALAAAHIRLKASGGALFWMVPNDVSIVLQKHGSDDLPAGAHQPALRNALAAWNAVSGSVFRFEESTSSAQQARTDWEASDIHLILFDEDNSSNFFPVGSGTVAVTPVLYNASSGRILDADVLFNGAGFDFTTSGEPGSFDVQAVATHELGHFLGLDHTGWAGATMYPYVSSGLVLQRSLGLDDANGARDAYPSVVHGAITGTVKRAGGMLVPGAFVVARDADGYTAASALADADGDFRLTGLAAGDYTLYATPLDEPVSSANLQAGHTINKLFASTVGGGLTLAAGATQAFGDLVVAADVALGLGTSGDTLPVRAVRGVATGIVTLTGTDLLGAALATSSPQVSVAYVGSTASSTSFIITAGAGAPSGHVDLIATQGGDTSILPAAIEVTPPDPAVTTVAPSLGTSAGGSPLTLTGSGFRAGARVVIGRRVYADGDAATVVNATTLTLTTTATSAGTYDVAVIDPSGVEGRKVGAFTFTAVPGIDSVFPVAGDAAGGTLVTILGEDFAPGLSVRIDGVPQTQVVRESARRLVVTTDAGTPGGPYTLEVENVAGAVATSAFSYAPAPDPAVTAASPRQADAGGGARITLTGSGFEPGMEVRFGVDPATGLGGQPGGDVQRTSATRLRVTAPAHAKGKVSVLVRNPLTGQAAVLAAGFTYQSDGGGGGGGCSTGGALPPPSIWNGRDALAGAWWCLAVWVYCVARRPRARPAAAA